MSARILNLSQQEYFANGGFSSSVAKVLIAKSPAHARAGLSKEPSKTLDRGSCIHRLVLGAGKDYAVIQHSDWRTKDSQKQRDDARAQGLVPVLAHEFEEYCLAAESIRVQLSDRGIDLDGQSEIAVEWIESTDFGDVRCQGMFDHAWIDRGMILDLKITEDACPSSVERTSANLGYGIQWAAYTRALEALKPEWAGKVGFAFAFCEPDEPYAINLAEPDGQFRELGKKQWLRAVRSWAECNATNKWPSYGTAVNPLSAPGWAVQREELSTINDAR